MNRSELINACFSQPIDPRNGEPDLHIEFTMEDLLDAGADHVIAHVGLCWREIDTTIGPVQMAGIALVCTEQPYRGLGLMTATMRAAHAVAIDRGYHMAGLFTDSPWLYRGLGYHEYAYPPRIPPHFMWASLNGEWDARILDTRGTW